MAGTVQPPRARAGVTFALASFELQDGRLVVSGSWHGVRGMRFVRPTLVVGGREVLATLEHKPWAPDADPWTAAFPWEHGEVDAGDVALAVAPSVTVPLTADGDDPKPARERTPKPAAEKRPAPAATKAQLSTELDALRDRLRSLALERDALRERLDEAARDREAALRTRRRMEAQRDEAFAERNTAERQRDQAIAERAQALTRRDEAIRDHEAATRAHRKLQGQRDAAVAALQAVEAARDQAIGEREQVVAQRDEVRGQRDDALLAQQALQRRIEEESAERARVRAPEPVVAETGAAAETRAAAAVQRSAPAAIDPAGDEPIGVRTVPAARSMAADLERPPRDRGRGLTRADQVAIRVFGSIAAICALLLLATLLRVFF